VIVQSKQPAFPLSHESLMTSVANAPQPRVSHATTPATRYIFTELSVGVLLSAAFTLLVVQWSLVRDKLAVFPPPRELAYANDALWRLRDFYGAGVGKLLSQWLESPPRSPLRSGLALAGYAVLGIHDWAPYAVNGVIILGLLGLCNWQLRGLVPWQRVAICVFVLTVPVSAQVIDTLQPELLAGLLMAAGATLLLFRPEEREWRVRLLAGGLFGLASAAEPAIFPIAILFYIPSLIATTVVAACDKPRPDIRSLLWRSIQPTLVFALIGLPILLPRFNALFRQMSALLPADQVFHRHRAGARWLYDLTGKGGSLLLGTHLFVIAAVVLTGMAAAARLKLRKTILRMASLLALAAVAYGLTNILLPGRLLMGGCFTLLLLNAALIGLNVLGQARPRSVATAAILIPALIGLAIAEFPPHQYEFASPVAATRKRAVLGIYQSLRSTIGPETHVIFCGGEEPDEAVNTAVVEYLSRKDERNGFDFLLTPPTGALPLQQLEQSQYAIVAYDANSQDAARKKAVQALRRSADFEPVTTFPISSFESYSLLKRVPDFIGFDRTTGIAPEEGPYPNWFFYRPVRWGLGAESTIEFVTPKAGLYRLAIDAQSWNPNQRIRMTLDGAVVADRTLKPGITETFDTALDLPGGHHELRTAYQPPAKVDRSGRALAVLFRSLRILPGGGYMGPPDK